MYFNLLNSPTYNPSSKARTTALRLHWPELLAHRTTAVSNPSGWFASFCKTPDQPTHNLINLSFIAAPLRPMVRNFMLLTRLCATIYGNISPKLAAPAYAEPRGEGVRSWEVSSPGWSWISKDPQISMETPHKWQGTGLPLFLYRTSWLPPLYSG